MICFIIIVIIIIIIFKFMPSESIFFLFFFCVCVFFYYRFVSLFLAHSLLFGCFASLVAMYVALYTVMRDLRNV